VTQFTEELTMCLNLPRAARPAAVALLLSACSAVASAAGVALAPVAPMRLGDVEIVDRTTGERLPIIGHRGERWVAGVPGHRYAIGVRNHSDGRVLAVMSVDGLNVVTGETAGWDQRGYVFAPGERYDIAGWRKSQERIAAFEFSALPDSYAARTGRPDNVGVIGVALFREAPRPAVSVLPQTSQSPQSLDAQAPAPTGAAQAAPERSDASAPETRTRLGTAHGRGENSRVSYADFERAQASPDEIIMIRYDRRENLIAMGVIESPVAAPTPFPSSIAGFVPDPPSR